MAVFFPVAERTAFPRLLATNASQRGTQPCDPTLERFREYILANVLRRHVVHALFRNMGARSGHGAAVPGHRTEMRVAHTNLPPPAM